MFLRDLTLIHDGNPDYINEANGTINFYKMRLIGAQVRTIVNFQSTPYAYAVV
jgi:hypothetical protein